MERRFWELVVITVKIKAQNANHQYIRITIVTVKMHVRGIEDKSETKWSSGTRDCLMLEGYCAFPPLFLALFKAIKTIATEVAS